LKGILRIKAELPDFSWCNILNSREKYPNDHKIYEKAINYRQWQKNTPNSHKIYQHFSLQGTPKFTQVGIFGLKICHLATMEKEGLP
jgi:hypothetical protein